MIKMSHILGGVVTLVFIYGAYTETGIWTALNFLLIFVVIEFLAFTSRQTEKTIAVLITVIALLRKNCDAMVDKK